MVKAFENLGHNVLVYNYRTVLKEKNNDVLEMNNNLMEFIHINKEQDLIVFCKTDVVLPETIRYATSVTQTWYWFMDPIQTARGMGANLLAREATYSSATCEEVKSLFLTTGAKDVFKINEGVDVSLYYNMNIDKKHDIIFFGSYSNKRDQILSYVYEILPSINLLVVGNGMWSECLDNVPAVYNEDLVKYINQSKLSINISRSDSYSDRVALSMACGTMVLSEYTSQIINDFEVNREVVAWRKPEELCSNIEYYLKEEDERNYIAEQGHNKILNTRTWEHSCLKILEAVNYA